MKRFAKFATLACLLGTLAAPAWAGDTASTPAAPPADPVAPADLFLPEPQQKDVGCTLTCPNGGPVYTCDDYCFVVPDTMLWCMRAEYWCEF